MLMHHLGSGICSQIRCSTGIIFMATRPATIIRSHWRGLNRITSAPNRAMSNRLAPTAISSIPQQAVANGIGHRLYLRHQLTTASRLVTNVFSGISAAPGGLDRQARTHRAARRCGHRPPSAACLSPFEDPFPPSISERRARITMKTMISQNTSPRNSAGIPAGRGAVCHRHPPRSTGPPPRDRETSSSTSNKQKHDRDQVEPDVKSLPGVVARVHPRLVRHLLDAREPSWEQEARLR